MRRVCITFGGSAYDATTALTVERAPRMGADEVLVYDDVWLLGTEFGKSAEFQWLLNHKGVGNPKGGRGFGWFAWKPRIIQHALSRLSDGDMVLYLDADTYPIADFSVLFDLCEKEGGHLAFMATAKTEPLCNRQWTKRDCFITMDCDTEKCWHGPHFVARFMVFRKGEAGVADFLETWQRFSLDQRCQTFEPSVLGSELPGPHGDGPTAGFREHRCEQSVYTNLCIGFGRRPYRECCEFGKDCPLDWNLYPQLFSQQYVPGRKTLEGSRFRNVA